MRGALHSAFDFVRPFAFITTLIPLCFFLSFWLAGFALFCSSRPGPSRANGNTSLSGVCGPRYPRCHSSTVIPLYNQMLLISCLLILCIFTCELEWDSSFCYLVGWFNRCNSLFLYDMSASKEGSSVAASLTFPNISLLISFLHGMNYGMP